MKKTEFLEHSPNQPIIQYNEGYTQHIPPSNHVLVSTPINISNSMSGNVMKPEWDELDRVIDEDALMDVDNLCQETYIINMHVRRHVS